MAQNTVEDFWRRVDKTESCWTWKGEIVSSGYGRFPWQSGRILAHRFSFSLVNGPIPAGMFIDHICRNRSCVNPSHMELVTHRDNVLRGIGPTAENARKTHCKNGHQLEEPHVYRYGNNRQCRICALARSMRRYESNKEKLKAQMRAYRKRNAF